MEERFAALRNLLARPPGEQDAEAWEEIMELFAAWGAGGERQMALDYAREHLEAWDDALRAWEAGRNDPQEHPAWPLVRTFSIGSYDYSLQQEWFVGLAAPQLTSVRISGSPKPHVWGFLRTATGLRELEIQVVGGQLRSELIEEAIAAMKALESLQLTAYYGIEDLRSWGALTRLRRLKLAHCNELSSLAGIEAFVSLQTLEIDSCKRLKSLGPLLSMPGLRRLQLNCRLRGGADDLEVVPQLKQLEEIELQALTVRGGWAPLELDGLDALRTLTLKAYHLKALHLGTLSGVETLRISGASMLKELDLSGLTKLKHLVLEDCAELTKVVGLDVEALISCEVGTCPQLSPLSRSVGEGPKFRGA